MEKGQCIFCGIVQKKVPSSIVYEDSNSVAFLDIAPRSKGMTIVASKNHYSNFNDNLEVSAEVLDSALTVAEMIRRSLNPKNIAFSILPSEAVPHFHVRIYPMNENEIPIVENQPLKISEDELRGLAAKIRSVSVSRKKKVVEEEPKEEEKPEEKKERTEEEVYWMKREEDLA